MSNKEEINEDESFIILGTSPGTSLDMNINGIADTDTPINKVHLENALKELPDEASMAFKAHFKLGDCPSPASMMIASTIVSDEKSSEHLQKKFGEILDENVILKETLKQNNDSMKEQFLLLASCQEDMMNTHKMHKEKFDETRELVERLREENKKLKQDIVRLAESGEGSGSGRKSEPSSAVEFVTSPDDDTMNKLTAQLELVEKQRRQVIGENEKLTWQKESLEHIVDATTRERDDLKEKVRKLELDVSSKDSVYITEISRLKSHLQCVQSELQTTASNNGVSSEEVKKRDLMIQKLEQKVQSLQGDLKTAQLKILDLENVKMEFTRHKSSVLEMIKVYREQIQELHLRLKEVQTTMFQPVRFSISQDRESGEGAALMYNVKLYDKTMKHLSELLNAHVHGAADILSNALGLVRSLYDMKLELSTMEQFKDALADLKHHIERLHSSLLNNVGQVRGTVSIFESIFKDYNEVLKKGLTRQENRKSSADIEALTTALVARGQELEATREELKMALEQREEYELLKAQLDVYKSDFATERESRAKIAGEKETVLSELRTVQRRNQELTKQLEELRRRPQGSTSGPAKAKAASASSARPPNIMTGVGAMENKKKVSEDKMNGQLHEGTPPPLRYDCPVCDKPFKTVLLLQQHVDTCLL